MANLREEGCWDSHYQLELTNFENFGDEGEVWFGKGLNKRIVSWIIQKLEASQEAKSSYRILDVGCGNAFTLTSLFERCRNVKLDLMGIDYSENSVELGKKIIGTRGFGADITLHQCDFLDTQKLESITNKKKFNIIIDIGTFDAILLLASNDESRVETTKLQYLKSLYSLVETGSILVLASCNHTKEEIMSLIKSNNEDCKQVTAQLIDQIETPQFSFGGKEGSKVTCLIFNFINQEKSEPSNVS